MEMMDINESIMDLQMDFDSARQEEILKSIDAFESTLKESITEDLQNYSGQKEFDLSRVKDYYLKKKYLRRIKDNLNQISPEV
jgi:molecular chaperone HscB